MPDNAKYYGTYTAAWRESYRVFTDYAHTMMAERERYAIDAVVAAVREDEAAEKAYESGHDDGVSLGRCLAARDIRADELGGSYVGNDLREHYARKAEGTG